MNKSGTVIAFVLMLSSSGIAVAQGGGGPLIYSQGAGSGPNYPSNAQKATFEKAYKLQQAAAVALDSGQYALAETDARQSLSISFGSGVAQEVLVSALVAQGKNQQAMDLYAQMEAENVKFPRVMLPYALLLLKSGQWAKALDAYDRALPNVGNAGLHNGNQLLTDDSIYDAGKPEPEDLETDIHIALGFTYIDELTRAGNSQKDKALSENDKALALQPDSALANLAYAIGLREVGRYADAMVAFQNVANKYSGDIKAAALSQINDPVLRWKATSVAK
jgi:tetratricopeptide (TPR) repeat protein